jgi:hypothetical protein
MTVLALAEARSRGYEVAADVLADTAKRTKDLLLPRIDSWPMTGRAHEGATPSKNLVPITYFGSAWATLGLMRSVPR